MTLLPIRFFVNIDICDIRICVYIVRVRTKEEYRRTFLRLLPTQTPNNRDRASKHELIVIVTHS